MVCLFSNILPIYNNLSIYLSIKGNGTGVQRPDGVRGTIQSKIKQRVKTQLESQVRRHYSFNKSFKQY